VPRTVRPKGTVVKVHVRPPLIDAELAWLLKYRDYIHTPTSSPKPEPLLSPGEAATRVRTVDA
jgi:hypothetical protein